MSAYPSRETLIQQRGERAKTIAKAGGLEEALASGALPRRIDTTVSEVVVLGLLRQGVSKFFCVFGHGSTEVGEVLRLYDAEGIVKTMNVRHEILASHAATSLRWVTGEKAAVVTSIGPGALQAMAGSIVPASNGLGVWHLYGDETTEDEGPNMQQIPKHEQALYLKLCSIMGQSYTLHTPGSIATALRRGMNCVDHPHRGGPFYFLLPMNTQPAVLANFNLEELPVGAPPGLGAARDDGAYAQAVDALLSAKKVCVRIGGGGRNAGPELEELLDLVDGMAILSPLVTGVIPHQHPRNMSVAGSKGSLCGNFVMDNADLLLAVGSRFVCQSDSSRTGYPGVETVINVNSDLQSAMHYEKTVALIGDAALTLRGLIDEIKKRGGKSGGPSEWFSECSRKRESWEAFKTERYENPVLKDPIWPDGALTGPAAIKIASDWSREHDAVNFFDAGDVQACGFQVVEDDKLGRTFTDTGASYMGYAVSSLLATAATDKPFYGVAFSGDGSFVMNPQILIDGVEHGARGTIVLLDNRRMGAITGLQEAQYGAEHATNDEVEVDYLAWARAIKGVGAFDGGRTPESLRKAMDDAYEHDSISVVYVRTYFGPDELGGLGAYGRWNVGNWVTDTQALRHDIGL